MDLAGPRIKAIRATGCSNIIGMEMGVVGGLCYARAWGKHNGLECEASWVTLYLGPGGRFDFWSKD
jgi:hypothetical protein